MKTLDSSERIPALKRLIPKKGNNALDVGCGYHFGILHKDLDYLRTIAVNACQERLAIVKQTYGVQPGWEYLCCDIKDYNPDCDFDLITALHVVEHLDLLDLAKTLDCLTVHCKGVFLIETPEQFDSNERAVISESNPFELHKSLVTAEFLREWDFQPVFRYWQNPQFSNAIYVRGAA